MKIDIGNILYTYYYLLSIKNVVGKLAIAQPTILGSVPRVLNRFYDVINDALNTPGCVPYIKISVK